MIINLFTMETKNFNFFLEILKKYITKKKKIIYTYKDYMNK